MHRAGGASPGAVPHLLQRREPAAIHTARRLTGRRAARFQLTSNCVPGVNAATSCRPAAGNTPSERGRVFPLSQRPQFKVMIAGHCNRSIRAYAQHSVRCDRAIRTGTRPVIGANTATRGGGGARSTMNAASEAAIAKPHRCWPAKRAGGGT